MRSYTFFLVGALSTLTACELGQSAASNDDTDSTNARLQAEMEDPANPADTANSVYYRARIDDSCGTQPCGFLVRRVNRLVTTCADGVARLECHVRDLDVSQLQLDAPASTELRTQIGDFLLRGAIEQQGLFRASEAWKGHPGIVATGTYVRATNSGIQCVTYPCPSYTAVRLNSDEGPQNVAGVKFDMFGKEAAQAQQQLSTPQGVLVAAQLGVVSGPAGTGTVLTATEYYLPFRAAQAQPQAQLRSQAQPQAQALTAARVGQACGSRGLPDCPTGQFCKFDDDAQCGHADQPGVCSTVPQVCTQQYTPVCGCDGQTYSSPCHAAAASASVDHVGECHGAEG